MKRCTRVFARSLYLLVYLVVGAKGNHDDNVGLEGVPRTLTFDSYYRNPLYMPMRPVYVSEVDVVSYIPDRIVTLEDRLIVGPTSKPVLKGVYHRLRSGENKWEVVEPERAKLLFDFSSDPQRLALLVNLTALSDVYEPLGATGAPRYFDPWPNSTINLLPQPSIAEQRAIFAPQIQRFREDKALKAQESSSARQGLDKMLSRLFPSGSVRPTSVLDVKYDKIAASFESQETWVASQLIFDFAILLELTGPSTRPQNVGRTQRLDLTIVPRVRRSRPTSVLCTPGASSETVSPSLAEGLPFQKAAFMNKAHLAGVDYSSCQLEADFNNLAASSHPPPESGRCERPTGSVRVPGQHLATWRTRLSSPEFEELHPEEAFWMRRRLDQTAPALAAFVAAQLPGKKALEGERARLKVGVVHGGEGKRGALHSIGVASSLFDLGIYNTSTWVGATSGSAWFLASWFASAKADNARLPSPASLFESLRRSLQRCALADEFDANEALTNYFKGMAPYHSPEGGSARSTQTARRTDNVLCDAELKLNAMTRLEGLQGLPSFFEYLTRAMAMQFLDPVAPRGISYTLSGLAADPLLAEAHLPLPVFQLHEGGDGSGPGSVWSSTPFDTSTTNRDLHASFPTHLLGSNALPSSSDGSGLITQYVDTLAFLASLSSHLLPRLRGEEWAGVLCGANATSPTSACGPLKLNNPFLGFDLLKSNAHDPSLFGREHVAFSDDGMGQGLPVWPFVTNARKADVLIASDASGGRQSPSFGSTPSRTASSGLFAPLSSSSPASSSNKNGLITSILGGSTPLVASLMDRGGSSSGGGISTFNLGSDGGSKIGQPPAPLLCALDRDGSDCPAPVGPSLSPNSTCCDLCKGPEADAGGCWPSDDPDSHPLFSLPQLGPGHSLPPLPTKGEDIRGLLDKVSIFGCGHVSSATPIVYIPHLTATSGVGGHPALKGLLNYNIPAAGEQRYKSNTAANVVNNAAHSVPGVLSTSLSTQPPLAKCLACLYYAKAMRDDDFMATDKDCAACHEAYCYAKPSSSTSSISATSTTTTTTTLSSKASKKAEPLFKPKPLSNNTGSGLISEPWSEGEGLDLNMLSADEDFIDEDGPPPGATLTLQQAMAARTNQEAQAQGLGQGGVWQDIEEAPTPQAKKAPPSTSSQPPRQRLDEATWTFAAASKPKGGLVAQAPDANEFNFQQMPQGTRVQDRGVERGGAGTRGARADGPGDWQGDTGEAQGGLPMGEQRLDQASWAFSAPSKPKDGAVWQAPDDSEFNFQQAPVGDAKFEYRGVEMGGAAAHKSEMEAEVLEQQAADRPARPSRDAVRGRRRRARRKTTGK